MFVKTLFVEFPKQIKISDENFLDLEDKILSLQKNLEYDLNENFLEIYNSDYINNEKISFVDYIEEGKILKTFLIENNFADTENYKKFFKIVEKKLENFSEMTEKIEKGENAEKIFSPSELDAMIAKVDKNDPKLVEVMKKIEILKNIKK